MKFYRSREWLLLRAWMAEHPVVTFWLGFLAGLLVSNLFWDAP